MIKQIWTLLMNFCLMVLLTPQQMVVNKNILQQSKFLVNSPKCKIPDVKPFNTDAKRFYKSEQYTSCRRNHQLLTFVTYNNDNTRTVHINNTIAPYYSNNKISCCYMNVTRRTTKKNHVDDSILLSKCVDFTKKFTTNAEYVSIKCQSPAGNVVYKNTHALIPLKIKRFNYTKAYSVLIVGFDSMSRLNLIRTMPKTYKFLKKNNWNTLDGYNKIAENTFPNLMAILTGYNRTESYSTCNPQITQSLDKCQIIWKQYKQFGYATAFAEDQTKKSTFNNEKMGFSRPPTDHYFRPLMIASEKLQQVKKASMIYCIGPETYGEKILQLTLNFANLYKNHASFGLFWINSFSHDDINLPGGMDAKVKSFLKKLHATDVTDNTIVIFLSDHGMRYGDIRLTGTGWLEDRLPFIFISVPNRFKTQFPNEYRHLRDNKSKLTTPFNLHMTLQHILALSGTNLKMQAASGCSKCKSLFEKIDDNYGCQDVGVNPHLCTCYDYRRNSVRSQLSKSAAKFVLDKLMTILVEYKMCARYALSSILLSQVSNVDFRNKSYILVIIETRPYAFFEATVSFAKSNAKWKFEMQGTISRVDTYSANSKCVKSNDIQKYCYCIS